SVLAAFSAFRPILVNVVNSQHIQLVFAAASTLAAISLHGFTFDSCTPLSLEFNVVFVTREACTGSFSTSFSTVDTDCFLPEFWPLLSSFPNSVCRVLVRHKFSAVHIGGHGDIHRITYDARFWICEPRYFTRVVKEI